MTEEEKNVIKKIIDNENNPDELKVIKNYIQIRIAQKNGIKELTEEEKLILVQPLPVFFMNNFPGEVRAKMNYSSLARAVGRIKNLTKGPVRIYHVLGITKPMLQYQHFHGEKMFDLLSQKLNEYGFPMDKCLPYEQIIELDKLCATNPEFFMYDRKKKQS